MERYDRLYRLYESFDAERMRAYRDFVDLFPPVDERVALDYWDDARAELEERRRGVRAAFPEDGDVYADIAARATRDEAFTGLDLATAHERRINALVLDVDETLRSAGRTDNEIPRETLHLLTEFHETGVPIVVCTGQTLENVKGFLIQGLGNELVHSGELSVVYESGTGVFTPGHGPDTKRLLYEDLDDEVRGVFETLHSRVLSAAPGMVRRCCHLQGNEFNVTLKPNFETGSAKAVEVVDDALVYLLDLLGEAVSDHLGLGDGANEAEPGDGDTESDADGEGSVAPADWVRMHYADRDPEIRTVLERHDALDPSADVPDGASEFLDRVDVAYYEGDAAEVVSRELNKEVGVRAAFDVLGIEDPFALVMGDSKSDLRVMQWVEEADAGISAAPEHASSVVRDHVERTDDLVFAPGDAAEVLRTVYVTNRLLDAD